MTLPAEQTTNPNGTLSTNIGGKVLHTIWNLPNDFFLRKILDNAYNFKDKLQIIINESEYVKDKNIPYSFFSSRDVKIAKQILQYDQSLSEENINFLQNIINCSTYHHYEIKMPFQDFNKNEAFLKPAQVILGWNCNELDDNIVKLRIFCREKEITVIKLKGKINYDKGIFDYDILPAVN